VTIGRGLRRWLVSLGFVPGSTQVRPTRLRIRGVLGEGRIWEERAPGSIAISNTSTTTKN